MNGWQIMVDRAAATNRKRSKEQAQREVRLYEEENDGYALVALVVLGAAFAILWMAFA